MKMSTKTRLLLSAITAASIAATTAPAFAQDSADEDVVVTTGTRLNVNPNLVSANPVLTVGEEVIASTGTVNIEDLTNQLPQVFAGQAAEVSNGASGTSTLNLRGLGAVRTLTLIDGRRLPYGSSSTTAVNLDLVPTNLVESIDILTGGASAVYGSDAIGGVANFILKDDFEGVELDAQFSIAQSDNGRTEFDEVLAAGNQPIPDSVWDGEQYNFSATFGANTADGRGNVTAFAAYQNRKAITQDNRSASACALGASDGAGSANGYSCIGSANFRLFGNNGFGFQQEDGTIANFFDIPGSERTFNFGPFNFFQRPAERVQLYTKAHYEVAPGHEAYGDISYTNNFSDAQIAPSASFGFGAYSINCDNPLIQGNAGIPLTDIFGCSAEDIAEGNDVSGITASHRNVEGGPRNSRLENTAYRLIGGLRGSFENTFDYDAFVQYSRTNDTSVSTNDFVVANLQQAFFAVEDEDGNVVCRDQSNGCVPYNIFQRGPNGETLVTQEALDFIQGVGVQIGETDQLVVGGNISANLSNFGITNPLAEGADIGVLFGAEYRRDALESTPDEISQIPAGGFTGVGGGSPPVAGNVNVVEAFAEVEIPLLTGVPFVEELIFNGQYRYSDYDVSGNGVRNSFDTDAYGLQLAWAPVSDVTIRAQFQRAVRAPNVIELFSAQTPGLPNLTQTAGGSFDPCSGTTPERSQADCANTGVSAAQYGTILDVISGQTSGIFGGNPNLRPEVSDTITLGAIFNPSFLPGFSASIDYFDIEIEEAIAAGIGADNILNQCLDTGDAAFCDLITRDASGSLNSGTPGVGFLLTNVNIASFETSGIDLQANYGLETSGLGEFDFAYAATILDKFDVTSFPGSPLIECAGEFAGSCGTPNPKYRHRAQVQWSTPFDGLQTTVAWRYYDGVDNDAENPAEVDASLATRNYIDLSANYEVFEGVTLRGGINNVFEEEFPVSVSAGPPFGNGNTFPTVYDTGRLFFMGLNVKL